MNRKTSDHQFSYWVSRLCKFCTLSACDETHKRCTYRIAMESRRRQKIDELNARISHKTREIEVLTRKLKRLANVENN